MLCRVREGGQGMAEYGLILLLVAMVVFVVLLLLGPIIGNLFTKVNSSLIKY